MADKRYTLRKDEEGRWEVIDMTIDFPAIVREKVLICLDEVEATDAANLLNIIDRMRDHQGVAPTAFNAKLNPLLLPVR